MVYISMQAGHELIYYPAQASYLKARPPDEVGSIITSLNEISQRLCPDSLNSEGSQTPAFKLAKTLIEKRDRGSQTEMPGTKPQQHASHLNGGTTQTSADLPGVLQHCAASPSSGVTPEGVASFGLEGLGHLNDRYTDASQLLRNGSGASPSRIPIPVSSLLVGGNRIETTDGSSRRDIIPISELLRQESGARLHNSVLDRDGDAEQRNEGTHF